MKREQMGDVWTLETPNEAVACVSLNTIAQEALDGGLTAQLYLISLWDEDWDTIGARLETEGSAWYVWYMDGVRQHLNNIIKQ